jgi:non-ribosomal peptide synthetase component E (peptide arylation enzyme)
MPDPQYGEKACAYLIAISGAVLPDVKELGAFLGARGLANFKRPERIEAIDAFPTTRVGKLDRQALRDMIAAKLRAERG